MEIIKWLSIVLVSVNVLYGLIKAFKEDELEDRIIAFIATILLSFTLYYLIVK